MDLSTQYLGLTLKNPIIVGSSGLTQTVDKIKACEAAGAGAVVMKSLFEEQIREADLGVKDSALMHPEAMGYVQAEADLVYGARDYLKVIEGAKKAVSLPVIASVNCYTNKWWVNYAQQIAAAGADALELNVYLFPFMTEKSGQELEAGYLEILAAIKEQVSIPVALKLSPYFTAFGHFASQLAPIGVDGLVLFNRFAQFDLDLRQLKSVVRGAFVDPVGFNTSLRWIALLSGKLGIDLVASGGIKKPEDVIKQLLAGAKAVQVVSILYQDGLDKIKHLLTGLQAWMTEKQYATLADFRGKLNQINNPQSLAYIRAQYLKSITGVE